MKNKIRLMEAILISLLPFNGLRTRLYRWIFKFQLHQSRIGWLSVINIDSLVMNNASVGALNFFTGPFTLEMEAQSSIGSLNMFRCGKWAVAHKLSRTLLLQEEAEIINQHYFDLFGNITIGKKTIIAGVRSQFWTHGSLNREEVDIHIGRNCYIGSGVKMAPGVYIADDTLCAMGSVVTKKFMQDNILIAGVPAKVIREEVNWRKKWQ